MLNSYIYEKFIKPRSNREDSRRREFILNLLLFGSILLALSGVIAVLVDIIRLGQGYRGEQLTIPLIVFGFFSGLYGLSRIRFYTIAAYIFVLLYYIIGTYVLYKWGILITQGLLLYVLAIVMSGILISTRFAFVITGLTSLSLIALAYSETHGLIHANYYWIHEAGGIDDAVVFSITLGVIAIVSWLSNREIEKSLTRARASEKAFREQRDQLEAIVEERTKQLQQAQLERVSQIYRFAELGRLASGVFHDLVNPLTTVSLNLEQLSTLDRSDLLERAKEGTKRIENFIVAARKQLQHQEYTVPFLLNDEIMQALTLLDHKSQAKRVTIDFKDYKPISYTGNPLKFHQIIVNLVSNAIDAFDDKPKKGKNRICRIELKADDQKIMISVQDNGKGMSKETQTKIFEPFFTTKTSEQGIGIGLSITKDIIEKDLGGTIEVKSTIKKGTTFIVEFPLT